MSIILGGMENWQIEGSQISNEKRAPGYLLYTGDGILPSYEGIIINHCKDPY